MHELVLYIDSGTDTFDSQVKSVEMVVLLNNVLGLNVLVCKESVVLFVLAHHIMSASLKTVPPKNINFKRLLISDLPTKFCLLS